jgi:hypothetical protein
VVERLEHLARLVKTAADETSRRIIQCPESLIRWQYAATLSRILCQTKGLGSSFQPIDHVLVDGVGPGTHAAGDVEGMTGYYA